MSIDLELWKKRKKELHLNYAMIAERANISKRSIEDIFRGFTTTPRIDTVEAIEKALELDKSVSTYQTLKLSENTVRITIEEIKTYMKKNKITYKMLADKMGLSISTITKIFGGYAKFPRADTMDAIKRALGPTSSRLASDVFDGGLQKMQDERNKSEKLIMWLEQKDKLGLTNKDIAEKSNIPLSTIEQIMCGKVKSPRLDTVQAIERALGLQNGQKQPKNPTSEIAENFVRDNIDLIQEKNFNDLTKLYRVMTVPQRMQVVAFFVGFLTHAGVNTQAIIGY